MGRSFALFGTAVALAGALLVSGCGSSGTVSLDPVAQAAEKTAGQGSARVAFSMNATQGGSSMLSGSANGVINNSDKSLQMTLDMQGHGQIVHMDMVMKKAVMYMRSPVFDGQVPAGTWLKFDLEQAGEKLGLDVSSLMNANPADALQTLRASSGALTIVGQEQVRGVATTHYRATVDIAKAVDAQHGATRETLKKLAAMMGTAQYPVDVWIDGSGLLRRLSESFSQTLPGTTAPTQMTMAYDLFDFGPEVDIQPPDDADVVDALNLPSA